MDHAAADKFLKALLNSALAVDAMWHPGWKREGDMTDAERARAEAWRRFNRPRPADRKPR